MLSKLQPSLVLRRGSSEGVYKFTQLVTCLCDALRSQRVRQAVCLLTVTPLAMTRRPVRGEQLMTQVFRDGNHVHTTVMGYTQARIVLLLCG